MSKLLIPTHPIKKPKQVGIIEFAHGDGKREVPTMSAKTVRLVGITDLARD